MINMIKANAYQLISSKLFRNTFIAVGILVVLVVCGPKLFSGGAYFIHMSAADRVFGFIYNEFNDRTIPMAVEMFVSALGFIPVLFIMAILYVEEFMGKPYRNGSLANTIACGYRRTQIYVTKIGTISLTMTLLILTLLIGTMGMSMIIPSVRESMSVQMFSIMMKMTLLVIFCMMACISLMGLIAINIKRTDLRAIVIICFFVVSATTVSDNYVLGKGMSCNPFLMLMDICSEMPDAKETFFIIIACISEILIGLLMGCRMIKKQEVK